MLVNFAKRKGNIPPAVRGDAKWRNIRMAFTLEGLKWEVGVLQRCSSWVAECDCGICTPFPFFCDKKWEMEIVREDAREILS